MSCFTTFVEEFPAAKQLQTTAQKKTWVVFVLGKAYVMFRNITQDPNDLERLQRTVAALTGQPPEQQVYGSVSRIDQETPAIIATLEDRGCEVMEGRLFDVVLHEGDIIWLNVPKILARDTRMPA